MLTDERKKQIESLLTDWGYWASKRSDYSEIAKVTGQINCSPLFKLTLGQLEEIESVEHRKRYQVYPDSVLDAVDRVVRSLPRKQKKILIAAYRWSDRIPVAEKAERLKICRKTFYNRLELAHEAFNIKFEWGLV